MESPSPILPEVPRDLNWAKIQTQLERLERRDWWLWSLAVVVMLLLTAAVISMSFPELIKVDDPFFRYSLNRAVRGLVGLVLIFNGYTVYQQWTIKRLRKQFSAQLNMMGRLEDRAAELHRLATVDALTGLYNRRYAEQRLAAETARSRRYGHPLLVLALDLNKFKEINDTHGHAAGDLVLRHFAERLNAAVRISDVAARMGGDEFLAILPECPAEQIDAILKRLRPLEVDYEGHKILVTFSAGWVGYETGESVEQFLDRADRTLYADKRSGKAAAREIPAAV
ncbi:MAG: GGDEF domain-containing protein [Candidatus Acidiferrales bacterium]